MRIGSSHDHNLIFRGHLTSSVTLMTVRFPLAISYNAVLSNQLSLYIANALTVSLSETFNGECQATVDMTLNDLYAKVKVIHFGTNRFLIYDFL